MTKFETRSGLARETVTRQAAARRQIVTAIELVLGNGDAVSANVLTWAATEMLRGVAKHRGVSTFQATLENRIKTEYLKFWREMLKGHYNYFKHADRDPERTVDDFSPQDTTWALFGACWDYKAIYGVQTWEMLIYGLWFRCRHPHIMHEDSREAMSVIIPMFDNPAGKPLAEAVSNAFEKLKRGQTHPELMRAEVGSAWAATLEWN